MGRDDILTIRKTEPKDLDEVMRIYDTARAFMRSRGNASQWCNGYPQRTLAAEDIRVGRSYVGTDAGGRVHMVFVFAVGADPTYRIIEQGHWLNEEPYGVIHRIGSDGEVRGAFRACLSFCDRIIPNIRIDTHEHNAPMRQLLQACGFRQCGIIYTDDGTPRLAFQRILEQSGSSC
jgi:hypothetical protein